MRNEVWASYLINRHLDYGYAQLPLYSTKAAKVGAEIYSPQFAVHQFGISKGIMAFLQHPINSANSAHTFSEDADELNEFKHHEQNIGW